MTKSFIRILALSALLAAVSSGQALTVFFATEGTEVAASGAGGTSVSPGNYAAVFRDEAILMLSPGPGQPSAAACTGPATWAAWFGDDDGDGAYTEGAIGHLDVLHLPAGSPNPPSVFDFFVSFSEDVVGPFGTLAGVAIRDGDVIRIRPGGGFTAFITEAQVAQAMNTAANLNVDGFTVNPANGDLYWSLSTTQLVNGVSVEDGGVVRLPASGYVANADGTVLSVTTGAAQIALQETHVNIFYFLAGEGAVGDLKDIAIDPAGGSFTGVGGITLPNLWFSGDASTSGPAIVRSTGGGTIATVNGVLMRGGPAFGLGATDFQGGPNSSLTCLAWSSAPLASKPRHLAVPDTAFSTPGVLKIDFGGGVPGPNFFLSANLAVTVPAGSGIGRTAVLAGSPLATAGSYRELYVDDFIDPLFVALLGLPPFTVNALGHASASFTLPAMPAGVAFVVQGIDPTNFSLTTPLLIVTQ